MKRGSNFETSELLEKSRKLSVHQLVAYHTLLTVHKSIFQGSPNYVSQKIYYKSNGTSRYEKKVSVHGKLTTSKSGFMYQGGCLWNQLPLEIRSMDRYKSFKPKFKKMDSIKC